MFSMSKVVWGILTILALIGTIRVLTHEPRVLSREEALAGFKEVSNLPAEVWVEEVIPSLEVVEVVAVPEVGIARIIADPGRNNPFVVGVALLSDNITVGSAVRAVDVRVTALDFQDLRFFKPMP